jgi:hypothetical protein
MSTKRSRNTAQEPSTPPPTDNSATEGQAKGALSVRTRRGVKTRRRAGMRFYQEPTTVNAADLSGAQIKALRTDPDLVVEETGRKGA